MFKKALYVWLFAISAMAANAASASGYKPTTTSTAPTSLEQIAWDRTTSCSGHIFDTKENMELCYKSKAKSNSFQYWKNGKVPASGGAVYLKENGQCVYKGAIPTVDVSIYTNLEITAFYQPNSYTYTARPYFISRFAPLGKNLDDAYYNNSSCTSYLEFQTISASNMYSYTITSEDGTPTPDKQTEFCKIPVQFANLHSYPKFDYTPISDGEGNVQPPTGSAFYWTRNTGIEAVTHRAINPNSSQSDLSNTPPAALFSKNFTGKSGEKCIFRRFREHSRGLDPVTKNIVAYRYIVQIMNGPNSEGYGDEPSESDQLGAMQKPKQTIPNEKTAKPLIPYGTKPDPDQIAREIRLIKDVVAKFYAEFGADSNAQERATDTIQVETDWSNKPTAYTHPSPEKLARDNPRCTISFNEKCAWKESEQPADENTKQDELLRLSNDGQTIVKNNTTIYNNTIYPPVMVNAGTAPDNGDPGSTDRPSDGTDGDGNDETFGDGDELEAELEHFAKCYDQPGDEECSESSYQQAVTDSLKSATEGFLPEAKGFAHGLVDRALDSGRCALGQTSVYCSLVASMANLKGVAKSPLNEDFILMTQQWPNPITGEIYERIIKIPAYVMGLIATILSIVVAWRGMFILLGKE